MAHKCPKCDRYGMEWDGRAKVLVCYFNTCNEIISIENQKDIPSSERIEEVIKEHESEAIA